MVIYTWLVLVIFIKLTVIVGRELGLQILDEEEIPFYPFRFCTRVSYLRSDGIILQNCHS